MDQDATKFQIATLRERIVGFMKKWFGGVATNARLYESLESLYRIKQEKFVIHPDELPGFVAKHVPEIGSQKFRNEKVDIGEKPHTDTLYCVKAHPEEE